MRNSLAVQMDPSNPLHIVTVWGAGYRFQP